MRQHLSIEVSLFQRYVFSNDQTMRGHFFQDRKHAIDVLIGVYKCNDNRQFSANISQVRSLYAMPTQKSGDCMRRGCGINSFFPEITEKFYVQRLVVPLVRFVKVDRNLNCHSLCILQHAGKAHARDGRHETQHVVGQDVADHIASTGPVRSMPLSRKRNWRTL